MLEVEAVAEEGVGVGAGEEVHQVTESCSSSFVFLVSTDVHIEDNGTLLEVDCRFSDTLFPLLMCAPGFFIMCKIECLQCLKSQELES